MYYEHKLELLRRVFGTQELSISIDSLSVGDQRYPILDDVIILCPQGQYTTYVKEHLHSVRGHNANSGQSLRFASDIQFSFGEEWKTFSRILPEHRGEIEQYLDIVERNELRGAVVCDLGCGNGRWSFFLTDLAQSVILVDFSDAIFVARSNLRHADNCIFFMGDLQELPFANDCADFILCLGVLHHLPTDALGQVRNLRRYAKRMLVYVYYALDNRPWYFRWLLLVVTLLRVQLARIRRPWVREAVTKIGTYGVYMPLIYLGRLLKRVGMSSRVPLYDFYADKGIARIKQDVYDRFFTSIEQRFTKRQIEKLTDIFAQIHISQHLPYWHFLCVR